MVRWHQGNSESSLLAFIPLFISGLLYLIKRASKISSLLGLLDLQEWRILKLLKIRLVGLLETGREEELLRLS